NCTSCTDGLCNLQGSLEEYTRTKAESNSVYCESSTFKRSSERSRDSNLKTADNFKAYKRTKRLGFWEAAENLEKQLGLEAK
ncbi:Uncharacterized protein FKW44_021556, partial [Caligus rogercresseyi]